MPLVSRAVNSFVPNGGTDRKRSAQNFTFPVKYGHNELRDSRWAPIGDSCATRGAVCRTAVLPVRPRPVRRG